MKELKTKITLASFLDNNDRPTCAINFKSGKVCQLLRVKRFGTIECCALDLDTPLDRYEEVGCLKPGKCCIVWKNQEEE